MGLWRKASFQSNDEEGIRFYHTQKINFPPKFVCAHSQTVAVCSCSYLANSRTKSYYLLYKKNYTSTSSKEEIGAFVKISCLTQRKQKHISQLQAITLIEFQILQFSTVQV